MRRLMRRTLLAAAVLGLTVGLAGQARADILAEFLSGSLSASRAFTGQSVTTEAGGPFDHIAFNFYSNAAPPTTPEAEGDLFILTQQYLGTPSDLSSSTLGFLAESTGVSGGVYQFASSVTLNGGTQYFFYTDATVATTAGSGYTGGNRYFPTDAGPDFTSDTSMSANFLLTGTAVAVPEPSTAVIAALGTVAFLAYGWSCHRREQRRPGAA